MYPFLLALHSLVRWVLLIVLLVVLARAYWGWKKGARFTEIDEGMRLSAIIVSHTQLMLGLSLYFISPIVNYFLHHFKEAVKMRQIRFFGMEHITMMLTAVVLITIGLSKAKHKPTAQEKFKTIAIWLFIGLLIILTSIPWSFSPLTSRPNRRFF